MKPRCRVAASIVLALLTVLSLSEVAPAAATPKVTIVGNSGFADFTLARTSAFDTLNTPETDPRHELVDIRGGRTYAGFCLVPFDARQRKLAGSSPCMAQYRKLAQDGIPLGSEGGPSSLAPGRYRLYLFADGPARITLALSGLPRSLTLRSQGRAPVVRASVKSGEFGLLVGRHQQSSTFSATGVAWVGWQYTGVAPAAAKAENICLVPAGGTCLPGFSTGGPSFGMTPISTYVQGVVTIYTGAGPDGNPAMRRAMSIFYTHVASDLAELHAFNFQVDLGPLPPSR